MVDWGKAEATTKGGKPELNQDSWRSRESHTEDQTAEPAKRAVLYHYCAI